MVWIPGGAFQMGSDRHYPEEAPVRHVAVADFWIDRQPVTNAEFGRFVAATGYITIAERPPDIPGSPSDPGSAVFRPPPHPVHLHAPDSWLAWWSWVPGASWRHPEGPGSSIASRVDHPVVHVAWADATTYAEWAGAALPAEAEWEFAARGGIDGADYAWGAEFAPGGQRMARTWEGDFPHRNLAAPGREHTAPVGSYPANGYGLLDMIGNVWEWTSSPAGRLESTAGSSSQCCGQAPTGTAIPERVIKGGSFLCAPSYCRRYRPAARQFQPIDSPTCHIGFRCVRRKSHPIRSPMTATARRYGVHLDSLHQPPPSRARSLLVWVLLIVGCALAALALVAVWANTLLLDDDEYVATIGPMATDAGVQAEITTVTTDGIMAALDLGFATDATRATVKKAVETFVSSGAFPPIWRDANRVAHIQVMGLITGKEAEILVTRDDEVYLELGPIVTAVADQLVPFGIDVSTVTSIAGDIEFPILTTDDLEPIQRVARLIDRAAFWFPALAAIALLAAIVISPRRLRALGRMGVGLIASGGLVLLAIAIAYRLYKNQTADSVPNVVSDRLFELLVDPLQAAALVLMATATVLAIATFTGDLIATRFRRFPR